MASALHVALRGSGENDVLFGGHQVLELLDERGNGAVEAQRGARVDVDFAERVVFVEHVDGAELIEIEAGVRFEQALRELRGGDRCPRAG